MRSEVRTTRQRKFKRHNGSEVNAMATKTSVKALLPRLHNKLYPSLGLHSPSDLGGNLYTSHS